MPAAVLQRLESLTESANLRMQSVEGTKITWCFSQSLAEQEHDFFHTLVPLHATLAIEYSVLFCQLTHNFTRIQTNGEKFSELELFVLTEQLVAALALAQLLTHLYRYYLIVPREVINLQEDQGVYRRLLRQLLRLGGYRFGFADEEQVREDTSFVDYLSRLLDYLFHQAEETTQDWNWRRLFSLRIRRVFTTLVPLVKSAEIVHTVNFLERYAAPAFNYISWLFYVPRLTTNVFLLVKHLIPGFWMDDQEKKVPIAKRLHAQLLRRWFELGNDTAWLIAGLLSCFVLTGALAPIGMYLTVSLFLFDALMAAGRAFHELGRLYKMRGEYAEHLEEANEGLDSYQVWMEKRISFEERRLWLTVINTSTLFIAMLTALPFIASTNPLIPFVGALLVLTITLTAYLATQYINRSSPEAQLKINRSNPKTRLEKLSKAGCFIFNSGPSFFAASLAEREEVDPKKTNDYPSCADPSLA